MNKEKLNKAFSAIDKSAAGYKIVKYLTDYPKVEMKSAIYKKKLGIIKDFIADLK